MKPPTWWKVSAAGLLLGFTSLVFNVVCFAGAFWQLLAQPSPSAEELSRVQWAACATTCSPGLVAVAGWNECRCHAAAPCMGAR